MEYYHIIYSCAFPYYNMSKYPLRAQPAVHSNQLIDTIHT